MFFAFFILKQMSGRVLFAMGRVSTKMISGRKHFCSPIITKLFSWILHARFYGLQGIQKILSPESMG
jgi:hypothetical protein